jgi:hypothetical protein
MDIVGRNSWQKAQNLKKHVSAHVDLIHGPKDLFHALLRSVLIGRELDKVSLAMREDQIPFVPPSYK